MDQRINGLLGRTLQHSFSVDIHRELNNPCYQLFELEPEQLDAFLKQSDIALLNITIPYKRSVVPYCAVLSEEARAIGSINTLLSSPEGLSGHNTDAFGLMYMANCAGINLMDKEVLIFGSGGTSATARFVAERAGAKSITVLSRTGLDAGANAKSCRESDCHKASDLHVSTDSYDNLARYRDAQILINTTPLGMYPERIGKAVVDLADFPCCEGVLDVVYNPLRTAFLMQAEERGVAHQGGLSMLVAQAKAAEELFAGQAIPDSEIERIVGLMRRKQENIVIIGMPGSGKTTVGRALSRLTGREVIDLDEKIVEAEGLSIPEIFARGGEEEFRRIESGKAAQYGMQGGAIIVAGGGVVKRKDNYASLHQNGRIYHLTRDLACLERTGRPLSEGADLEQMLRERLPLYLRFRDVEIENAGSPEQVALRIWQEFEKNSAG